MKKLILYRELNFSSEDLYAHIEGALDSTEKWLSVKMNKQNYYYIQDSLLQTYKSLMRFEILLHEKHKRK